MILLAVPRLLYLELLLPLSHVVLQGRHTFLLGSVVRKVDLVEAMGFWL
jgi:hypothetical protein